MKFRPPEGRGQKILRPTPVRDGVVRAPRLLTTEWKYGLARDEFLHTPRSRRQMWGAQARICRSVFYLTGLFEFLFANNLSGGIDLQALLLALSILSGEPAGDQGTFLGKPPRKEIRHWHVLFSSRWTWSFRCAFSSTLRWAPSQGSCPFSPGFGGAHADVLGG